MLIICTKEKCHSSKRAKQWLDRHQIVYREKKLAVQRLTMSEFLHILLLTENGTGDILSHRAALYKQLEKQLDYLLISELWQLVCQKPGLLRSPIIFNDTMLLVGFNADEMRTFIPRAERRANQRRTVLESGCLSLSE